MARAANTLRYPPQPPILQRRSTISKNFRLAKATNQRLRDQAVGIACVAATCLSPAGIDLFHPDERLQRRRDDAVMAARVHDKLVQYTLSRAGVNGKT